MQRRRKSSERDTHFGRRGTRGAVKSQMRCVRRVAQRSRRAVARLTRRTVNGWLRAQTNTQNTRTRTRTRKGAVSPTRPRDVRCECRENQKHRRWGVGGSVGMWNGSHEENVQAQQECVCRAGVTRLYVHCLGPYSRNEFVAISHGGGDGGTRVNERYLGMTHKHRPRCSPPLSLRPRST